jgi:hypothetical protein
VDRRRDDVALAMTSCARPVDWIRQSCQYHIEEKPKSLTAKDAKDAKDAKVKNQYLVVLKNNKTGSYISVSSAFDFPWRPSRPLRFKI